MHPDHVTLTADEIEAAADKLLGQYTADGYSQVTLPNLINFVSALVMFTVLDKAQPDKHAAFDEFRTALRRLGNANDPLSVADRVMILSNATFLLDEYARAHTPQPTTPRSTAEQIDAVFRRNLDLLIQNLTVDSDNKITWMSIVCRGVEQSLYPLASKRVTHYQQLLGVAHVVLGCLVANGVDIPERFLDAFGDPDSVESPLELLPCDFLPAQAVGAAVQQAAPVAWSVYNGVCLDQIFMLRESADKYAANMQKSHDLSGSLAAFVVKPLYAAPQG